MPNTINYNPPADKTANHDGHESRKLIPEIWARELQEYRKDNLVMWPLIDGQFSNEIQAKGDVLHINFAADLDTEGRNNAPTDGTQVDIEGLDISQADLKIDRYERKALGVQDVLKAQGAYELRSKHSKALSRYLDAKKDQEIFYRATEAGTGFSNSVTVTGKRDGKTGYLAFGDIVEAATLLDEKNVPEDDRYIVVNSRGRGDLRQIPEFVAYKETGESGLVKSKTGWVGELYGMPVYVTNAVSKVGTDYAFLMFHKSALIGATQAVPGIESDRDARAGMDILVAHELFGVSVLRPDHGVVIKRPVTPVTTP